MTQHLFILTGTSRGMGFEMARQLLAAKHTVIGLSRSSSPALAEAATHCGGALLQWTHDLADAKSACTALTQWLNDQAASPWGSATLINNAGVIAAIGPLSQADAMDTARALRVGLEAPMLLTAAFLSATSTWRVPRKVLNISSGLGRRAMASQAAYCAAKAGMDHFTRCLALDEALDPNGAKVCSLAPGVIDTDMQTQLRSASAAAFPDVGNFMQMKSTGALTSPAAAAKRVLAFLDRSDFGLNPTADVRD